MQKIWWVAGAIIPIMVLISPTVMAFSYTGNGYNDGVNAAREDFNSGQNDDSCNDHFSNQPNFNVGNEAYCAGFKVGYAAEMVALGATK